MISNSDSNENIPVDNKFIHIKFMNKLVFLFKFKKSENTKKFLNVCVVDKLK